MVQVALEQRFLNMRHSIDLPGTKARYHGSEIWDQNSNGLVHAAFVVEIAATETTDTNSLTNSQCVLVPHVKRASNATSPLYHVIAKGVHHLSDVSAFNASYSDSGLFTICTLQVAFVGNVIRAVCNQIKIIAQGNLLVSDAQGVRNKLEAGYIMQWSLLRFCWMKLGHRL